MSTIERLRLEIRGAVQGVGFRPFVYRLAGELGLAGWVRNDARGVFIEVEGDPEALERFRARVRTEAPRNAHLDSVTEANLAPAGFRSFEIRASDGGGARTAAVLPDLATCPECLAEVLDPSDRRHRYAFANCTHCGPRFTILRALPYDRPNTTMRDFRLCPDCRAEYEDPSDRRFHAQPVACPACGPALALWDAEGRTHAHGDAALAASVAALAAGDIVAVKGLGGFHLVLNARDPAAVARLRTRKGRMAKPFALMVRDLDAARALCEVGEDEARALVGPEAPILLMARRPGARVADGVAPGNPRLGVMLPATPLHHLLTRACGFPLVATSGNRSEEPICTDEREALARLGSMADRFLVHDRPIERPVDDSVAWVSRGRVRLLRRARGFAPLPVPLPRPVPPLLAVGGHLKGAVALGLGDRAMLSQHIGDLENPESQEAFERVIADFLRLYDARPVAIAHDLHPDYASTRWALEAAKQGLAGGAARTIAVQHHHAHLAACLAEHPAAPRALGVIWDGTGFGPDGTVWGGEFLQGDAASFERVARLRPFRLPGADAAVREPRRSGLALLWEVFGPAAFEREDLAPVLSFSLAERAVIGRMLERGVRAPVTTSAGRLFDGVAALLGLASRSSFEGEAAMALEGVAASPAAGAYPLPLRSGTAAGEPHELDWRPTVVELLGDLERHVEPGVIAARFHGALVAGAVAVATACGEPRVALSGGCFQNRRLTESLASALERAGHEVLLHERVPPNDGGLALGQLMVAAAEIGED